MKRREFVGVLGAGIAAALLPRSLPALYSGSHFIERWSWAMGQPVHLQLFARSESHGYDAAAMALSELRRVEAHLTLFDDRSDLSELNRLAGRRAFRPDHDLAVALSSAVRVGRATGGAFNCAIEPLMRAWGFRTPRSSEPSAAEIREARHAVEAGRLMIQGDRVWIPSSQTRLDLGGIGVGYGLDRAASALRRMGIGSAFLDVSGDCIAIGAPPGVEEGWLVEIADPRGGGIVASIHLRDAALATSSNTVSVVRYGRMLRGHVIDPETGWPADRLVQVTVVAKTGTEADALSTGMLVSGKPSTGVLRYYQV